MYRIATANEYVFENRCLTYVEAVKTKNNLEKENPTLGKLYIYKEQFIVYCNKAMCDKILLYNDEIEDCNEVYHCDGQKMAESFFTDPMNNASNFSNYDCPFKTCDTKEDAVAFVNSQLQINKDNYTIHNIEYVKKDCLGETIGQEITFSAPMLAIEQMLYSVDDVGNIDDEDICQPDIQNEFYSLSFNIKLR